eukprot:3157157-Rhodomonas_salina.1
MQFITWQLMYLRIDLSNARLHMVEQVIRLHGMEYERVHMQKRLTAAGVDVLDSTKKWVAAGVGDTVTRHVVSLQSLLEGNATAFERVHAEAVLALVMLPVKFVTPVLLQMDAIRLQSFQAEFAFSVFACTALVLLSQKTEIRELLCADLCVLTGFLGTHPARNANPDVMVQGWCAHGPARDWCRD